MKDPNLILATDGNGNDITINQIEEWLKNSSKQELADFLYHRFYGRYLKPFDFNDVKYKLKYKSGFAIMTSCCLRSQLVFYKLNANMDQVGTN